MGDGDEPNHQRSLAHQWARKAVEAWKHKRPEDYGGRRTASILTGTCAISIYKRSTDESAWLWGRLPREATIEEASDGLFLTGSHQLILYLAVS